MSLVEGTMRLKELGVVEPEYGIWNAQFRKCDPVYFPILGRYYQFCVWSPNKKDAWFGLN